MMGLLIQCINENSPYPKPLRLTLTCDNSKAHSGFLTQEFSQSFTDKGGFIPQYRQAMRAGWKDTHRNGLRVFLCPQCSGKTT